MDNWQLPPELQRIEQQLRDDPLPDPPAELRRAVLEDPRAVEFFASRQRLAAESAGRAAGSDVFASTPRSVISSRDMRVVRRSRLLPVASVMRSGTVIVLATLAAWYFTSLNYPQGGQSTLRATRLGGNLEASATAVGRITGAVDCSWAAGTAAPSSLDYVTVGQQIKLSSGLLEITYDSGTKIILLGPVTFTVGSDGGYLASGRLVAKLKDGRDFSDVVGNEKSSIRLGRFKAGVSSAPELLVRTPAVGIFNVGKEFGVKVDEQEKTTLVHVFQGSVALCSPVDSGTRPWRVLEVKESVLLEVPEAGEEPTIRAVNVSPREFVHHVGTHRRSTDVAAAN